MVENIKILILEDNQSDADLLQRELKKSGLVYTSEIVQTRQEFESSLENFKPDLILADYSLPSFDGDTAFDIKQKAYPDIPFIIISGFIGEENAVELIKKGITDYVLKDKLFGLNPKIKRALEEAKEKKGKRIADEQLALQKRDSKEQFKTIFNDAPMGIAIIDSLTGNLFNVNPMFAKIVGRSIAEMTNIDWMSITHPDDIQPDLNNMAQLVAGEINGFRMEKRFIHSDGSSIWINMTVSRISHYDKSNPRHLCMIEDITEHKKAEQELIIANGKLTFQNEGKEKRAVELNFINKELADYKFALDQSCIIAITDQKGVIKHVNDNFCKISKYNREELIGRDHRIISSGYHSKEYIHNLWSTIAQGKTWYGELKNKAKDGTFYWVDTTITPFLNEQGKPYQYVATRFDITEGKKAKQNLIQQNKELVKTNTELDRFVYSASHDLRSPLTSILGLISFIEEESQETDTLEHIKMIRNSINRLDMFIKNILNYSRNNRAILEVEKIFLQETAREIVNSLHSMKEAKGIHFEIDIKEQQPFYSDRLRFNTILENLISNAIKYHKDDKSDSYIKITGQSDHEKLQINIADNGIGIEQAQHNKIFDMFFRLSGKTDGSGIGLYIVKETVEILKGSIQIQSEKGTGTIFTIILKNLKP